jgi:hypothetical protein
MMYPEKRDQRQNKVTKAVITVAKQGPDEGTGRHVWGSVYPASSPLHVKHELSRSETLLRAAYNCVVSTGPRGKAAS